MKSVISDKKGSSIELGHGRLHFPLIKFSDCFIRLGWNSYMSLSRSTGPFQVFLSGISSRRPPPLLSFFDLGKNDLTSKIINQTGWREVIIQVAPQNWVGGKTNNKYDLSLACKNLTWPCMKNVVPMIAQVAGKFCWSGKKREKKEKDVFHVMMASEKHTHFFFLSQENFNYLFISSVKLYVWEYSEIETFQCAHGQKS